MFDRYQMSGVYAIVTSAMSVVCAAAFVWLLRHRQSNMMLSRERASRLARQRRLFLAIVSVLLGVSLILAAYYDCAMVRLINQLE